MGEARCRRRRVSVTPQPGMRAAYGASAEAWAGGAAALYAHLAELLLAASPIPLASAVLLDVGAGTGVVSEAAVRAGARSIALDASVDMLAWQRRRRPPGVAADAERLPFRDDAFDAVAAACCLSHLEHPQRALAEARRVVRRGGAVLASTFGEARPHPVKAQIDAVLQRSGYAPPAWYLRLKTVLEPRVATAAELSECARAAGLHEASVSDLMVETPLRTARALVDWRLGMAQYAAFLAALPLEERTAIRAAALNEVGSPPALVVHLIVLSARVG